MSIPLQDPNKVPDKSEFKLAGKVRQTVQDAPNSLVEKALPEAQKAATELPSLREPCSGEWHASLSPGRSSHAVWAGFQGLSGCHGILSSPWEPLLVPGMMPPVWQLAHTCPEDSCPCQGWLLLVHSMSAVPGCCLVDLNLLQHSSAVHRGAALWLCEPRQRTLPVRVRPLPAACS